ncbi:glycoside hydrolase family 76 protein [Kocuria sp.]|uniref:glycoside hydrolase family 76 protein n=1 Tax=Kocuria sp. TaxID=1871328 RepID=UPI0026E0E994|nr:glycoside hydrolase family 76 protein [Kocuria sp.]MDO5619333.1 glycoside hydrolase family 76 protein [Kocuria sp.]
MSHDPTSSLITGATGDRRERAALAARSVQSLFGERLFGIPGTWIGAVEFPHPTQFSTKWHYWWQAHLLDALVDAAQREAAMGQDSSTTRDRAHQLLRAITLRSGGQVIFNNYYDDMAWLMLALGRFRHLEEDAGGKTRRVVKAGSELLQDIRKAHTRDLDGGMFWTRERTYKNTATTGPAALIAVRTHAPQESADLLGWLRAHLWDSSKGVFLDGINIVTNDDGAKGTSLEKAVYTYNSGPALGAAVELAETSTGEDAQRWADFAAQIVAGADAEFGRDMGNRRVLKTHGSGDAGLFTGILVRYLAEAAHSPVLDPDTRETARRLVLDTADAFWAGRREFDPDLDFNDPTAQPDPARVVAIFSPNPLEHADTAQPVGRTVELGTQVQAWTALEAAARLAPTV